MGLTSGAFLVVAVLAIGEGLGEGGLPQALVGGSYDVKLQDTPAQ